MVKSIRSPALQWSFILAMHMYEFLLEEPVIEETTQAERSAYGYFLQIACMTLHENHLTCWHLLKVAFHPER